MLVTVTTHIAGAADAQVELLFKRKGIDYLLKFMAHCFVKAPDIVVAE